MRLALPIYGHPLTRVLIHERGLTWTPTSDDTSGAHVCEDLGARRASTCFGTRRHAAMRCFGVTAKACHRTPQVLEQNLDKARWRSRSRAPP